MYQQYSNQIAVEAGYQLSMQLSGRMTKVFGIFYVRDIKPLEKAKQTLKPAYFCSLVRDEIPMIFVREIYSLVLTLCVGMPTCDTLRRRYIRLY